MLQKSHSTWLQNDRILEFSPIFPKVREFRDFRDFGKPNRCQKAQISSKWSLPPTHKFYMFNNTIGCDSVPIFSMIGAGPVLTFEKHRLYTAPGGLSYCSVSTTNQAKPGTGQESYSRYQAFQTPGFEARFVVWACIPLKCSVWVQIWCRQPLGGVLR